mgnify:CR=1 FL=1
MVIADSSVWITFQRDPNSDVGRELNTLLADDEVIVVGPVLTEILQGARSDREFAFLAERLRSLAFQSTDQDTWIQAGELNFQLKREGLTLAFADLIVSALAVQHGIPVYTINGDFQRVRGLRLYEPRP